MAKMPNIARKLVSGVGFSNGCALLALKKPPPLVPNCLMISCDATGPCAIICSRTRSAAACRPRRRRDGLRVDDRDLVVRLEVLHHALRDEEQRADDRRSAAAPRATRAPCRPRSCRACPLLLGDAADEGDRHRDADRRRHEVVIRQPGHLREIAHGRFAAVGLPVRVRRERHGGVERQVGRDAGRTPAD